MSRNFKRLSLTWLTIILLSSNGQAHFAIPQLIPVERLVKNGEAYLAIHRNEADAHYTLGRIHYLAFHTKQDHAPAYRDYSGTEERLVPGSEKLLDRSRGAASKIKISKLSDDQLINHAARAVHSYNEAIRLDSKNALYYLGLASLLEEFLKWREAVKPKKLPSELEKVTVKATRTAYAQAFRHAAGEDLQLKELPLSGIDDIISYEAAAALIRLSRNTKDPLSEQDKKDLREAQAAVAHFNKLPPSSLITPIVFSLQPGPHLVDLLAPERTVDFDLRGYGPRETWPWVKAELGFLVWDPSESGRIESAQQMFGGYTFQIFWRTGYDALRALDDNDDGVLSGRELDGISVWFDRNGDAVSQPDEVVPLRRLGIVSIAVTANGYDGIHPTNAHGIKLRDGRVLRTWHWMVEPRTASRVAAR